MIIKKINELADDLNYENLFGRNVDFDEGIPFLYDIKNSNIDINVGKKGKVHHEMRVDGIKGEQEGRYWPQFKIISFWDYPNEDIWKKFIMELEKVTNLKIWNNNWRVEIFIGNPKGNPKENMYKIVDDDISNYIKYYNIEDKYVNDYKNSILIPVEKYEGTSEKLPEIYKQQHLMNILQKERLKKQGKIKVPKGFGSRYETKPLKFKQYLMRSESKIFESPDNVEWDHQIFRYDNNIAKPFAFKVLEKEDVDINRNYLKPKILDNVLDVWIGDWGEGHGDISDDYFSNCRSLYDNDSRGRLWYLSRGSKYLRDEEKGAWRFSMKRENKIYNFNEFKIYENNQERISFKMNIPQELYEINNLYKEAEKDLFIVGGAVRDAIQGKKPHDFDLVTNAMPEESKRILKDWNISKEEQGQNFGVLRLYTENNPEGYEIATYRKDIVKGRDTKGNDQKVEIGQHITIKDDVQRRDITWNALFYDIDKQEIVDYVGGIKDLKNKIVKTVGDPQQRFDEDRLRILRIFRFASRTNSDISKETSEAIKKDNRLRGISIKDDVSQERIIEEFYKMYEYSKDLNNKDMFINYLKLLEKYKMWNQMFPGIRVSKIMNYKYLNDLIILSNIFSNNDNLEYKMMMNKFPSKISKIVSYLESFKDKIDNEENSYQLMKDKSRLKISDDLLKKFAETNNLDDRLVDKFIRYCNLDRIKAFDLMEQGYKGKELGDKIKEIELENYKNV